MRVLHVCGCYLPATEWGGPPPAVAAYVAALSQVGVSCEVFTTTARASREYPPIPAGTRDVGAARVSYFSAPDVYRSFIAPSMWGALRRRVREFDLVHLHMMWAFPGIAAARVAERAGVPYVLTPHGALDPWALGQFRWMKRGFLLFAENHTLRHAALVHYTAESERAVVPQRLRALPSAVVPNVVEASTSGGMASDPGRPDTFEIAVLGRIHPMKGFDVLVPALRGILRIEPRARLVVAGRDEAGYGSRVEALARRHGVADAIQFVGHVDEAGRARLFGRAALLAAPSHRENFGLAIAEAMAAGLPVVISDRVNISDDVAHAGAGEVVPLESAAFARAILGLLADPSRRAAMGARGRSLVRERYAAGTVGLAMRSAYESAIARRNR